MIDLYFAPTPNGWKPAILLEELGVEYRLKPLDLTKGKQFTDEFRAINDADTNFVRSRRPNTELGTTITSRPCAQPVM